MKTVLERRSFDDFAHLLSENWTYQKELHTSVTSNELEELFDFAFKHGARGGKACGAGGGGCCIFAAQEGRAAELRAAFRRHRVPTIDFDFDSYGVYVSKG